MSFFHFKTIDYQPAYLRAHAVADDGAITEMYASEETGAHRFQRCVPEGGEGPFVDTEFQLCRVRV